MRKMVALIIGLILLSGQSSCSETNESVKPINDHAANSNSPPANNSAAMNDYRRDALVDVMTNSPITVLLAYDSVDIVDLPDADPSDDYAEQKQIYCGRVLEVFQGPALTNVCYYAITEKGEDALVPKEPQIVALCTDQSDYYWPGVGTSFPAEESLVLEARRIANQLPKISMDRAGSYSLCE